MLARSITAATFAAAALLANAEGMCAVAHADTCLPILDGAAQACTSGSIENLTNDKVIQLVPLDNSPPPKPLSMGPTPAGWALQQLNNEDDTLWVPPLGSAQIFGPTRFEVSSKATREQSAATSLCNASKVCKYLDPGADFRACVMGMATQAEAADNGAKFDAKTFWADVQTVKACKKAVGDMFEKEQKAEAAPVPEETRILAADKPALAAMESVPQLYKSDLAGAFRSLETFSRSERFAPELRFIEELPELLK